LYAVETGTSISIDSSIVFIPTSCQGLRTRCSDETELRKLSSP
jgi:hypothetical protein